MPKAVGRNWDEFCDLVDGDRSYPVCKQFHYDPGHAGVGLVVSTGYGDGIYPVYATFNHEGRIASVRVDFISPSDA